MRFFLLTVNTELSDNHVGRVFASMDEVLAWVAQREYEWTSLLVTVLPAVR